MLTLNKPPSFNVRARTAHVREHHYSPANPDKPLWLVVPGAMVALLSLLVILSLVYQTWYQKSMKVQMGFSWILFWTPIYAGGVFCFSYGYELYDMGAATRLTLIIVGVTVLAVVMLAVLFALLSDSKSGSKSSGSSRGGGSSSLLSGRSSLHFHQADAWSSPPAPTPAGSSGPLAPVPPPVAPAPLPLALACPACGQSFFLGLKTLFCPSCGVALPPELLDTAAPPGPPP